MHAELIAIRGPLLGSRYRLGEGEFSIGRAPSSSLQLPGGDIPWRYCVLQPAHAAYEVVDLRSGRGTLVNGARVERHTLEDGDQVVLGDNIFVFRSREGTEARQDATHVTVMRASAALALFRSLALAEEPALSRALEARAGDLVSDLARCECALVLLGSTTAEMLQRAADQGATASVPDSRGLDRILGRVENEGLVEDSESGWLGAPLFVRSQFAGTLLVRVPDGDNTEARDTLSAVATLASAALENARDVESLRTEKTLLLEQLHPGGPRILGESVALKKLLQMIERLGPQQTTVLILGESGTGKELVARGIHERSTRHDRPFVAINCAALTESLLESEMFGYEKGAFTGAVAQKKGKLEMAQGGTVFLDEIGELAPALQAKMLRVLQQREFERVGGTKTLPLDVRLIAATNRDLAQEVKRGAFREDLYHRLNVVTLRTPPLREHPEDIPALASHFVAASAARCGRRIEGISPAAQECLMRYAWPGNVRELENAMERAVVLGGDSGVVLPEDLPESVLESAPVPDVNPAYYSTVTDAKRESIIKAWRDAKGDYKIAAAILGLHPNSLLRLIRNLNLRDALGASAT